MRNECLFCNMDQWKFTCSVFIIWQFISSRDANYLLILPSFGKGVAYNFDQTSRAENKRSVTQSRYK